VFSVFSCAALASCGSPFPAATLLNSVRLLAIHADKPYAEPGDTVKVEALAVDFRPTQPARMQVFWVPLVCPNPPGDSYFACYLGFDKLLQPGVDLTSSLHAGTSFSFHMPEDIITSHPPRASGTPFGMVVVFAIACAGHVQLVPATNDTVPPPPPLGCFDDHGKQLGPDDSVFAYAQVFSFADHRTNANPVISNLTFAGTAVDPTSGITVNACPTSGKCTSTALDTVVPSSSAELDPADLSSTGTPLHEEIWVNYFLTAGQVGGSTLLYDASAGKIPNSSVQLTAPTMTGDSLLWAVVRDNRGGVNWIEVPLHAK
jgi:hypothetical protein